MVDFGTQPLRELSGVLFHPPGIAETLCINICLIPWQLSRSIIFTLSVCRIFHMWSSHIFYVKILCPLGISEGNFRYFGEAARTNLEFIASHGSHWISCGSEIGFGRWALNVEQSKCNSLTVERSGVSGQDGKKKKKKKLGSKFEESRPNGRKNEISRCCLSRDSFR